MKPVTLALLALLAACSATNKNGFRTGNVRVSQDQPLEVVFERVRGSVVTIFTVGTTGLLDDAGQAVTEQGVGSGVLISEGGRILTAAHVVHTADSVSVEFVDGTRRDAQVIGTTRFGDLAVIQLEGELPAGISPASVGDSDLVRIGSKVFVVGAPLGISHTLTVGYISARRVSTVPLSSGTEVEVFQTDAAINTGNSGGPLFNMRGEVIGIVSYIVSKTGGSQGLGFAITTKTAKQMLLGRNPFWSGLNELLLSGPYAAAFNLPEGRPGLLVLNVAKDSPGERLGLRGGSIPAKIEEREILLGGDVILEAFGIRLDEEDSVGRILKAAGTLKAGEVVRVKILRAGKIVELAEKIEVLMPWIADG